MPSNTKKKQGSNWYESTAQAHAEADQRCGWAWQCACGPCTVARRNEFKPAGAFNLVAFRERFPFKPWDAVLLDGRIFETISYPWPQGSGARINVREPGNPATIREVDTDDLKPINAQFEIWIFTKIVGQWKYPVSYPNLQLAVHDATTLSTGSDTVVAVKTLEGALVMVTRQGGLQGDEVEMFNNARQSE